MKEPGSLTEYLALSEADKVRLALPPVRCNALLALRIRNLIAAREFNTAQANHELSRDGWLWDHAQMDKEIAEELDALIKEANNSSPSTVV